MRSLVNRRLCLASALLWSSVAACQADQPTREKPEAAPAAVAPLNANPKLADFVVLAQNSVRLQTGGVVVNGGDIGARGTGSGPFLSGNVAVDALTGVTVQAARTIIADSVRLGSGVRVGDIQTNRLTKATGATHGSVTGLVPLPALPAAAPVAPGTTKITVATGATASASPGRFGAVSVGSGGKLRLAAGTYEVAEVTISSGARIEALGPVQLRIAGRLSAVAGAIIGAAPGAVLGARDIRVEVLGSNGTTGALTATPPAASFTSGAQLTAVILVPNGTLVLGSGANGTGAFAARDVDVGVGTKLTFKDGFQDSACSPATCGDGNPCNGVETCQGNQCVPGTPVVCTARDACHLAGVCNPATGTCSDPIAEEGGPCDDGSACTLSDTCLAGTCVGGTSVVCTAQGPCRLPGSCNPTTGLCTSPLRPDGSQCNDGDACTRTDACVAGTCVGGEPVTCSASGPCRVAGACNPASGTCSDPAAPDGTPCSDGSGCTLTDVCVAGACTSGPPVTCPPADQCHQAGLCNPLTGTCSNVPKPNGSPCNDNNACTAGDTCQAGACTSGQPVACAPAGPCKEAGVCNPTTGTCTAVNKPEGMSCSDGNACTHGDTCRTGVCTAGEAVSCLAPDSCHTDGACDPATGTCTSPARPDGTACDDGDPCTLAEVCQAGICGGASPVVCAPIDGCHASGMCDPLTGLCSNPTRPDGFACNDGSACSRADVCQAGLCVGGDPVACAAADSCHVAGSCDPQTGTCSSPEKPNDEPCDDGNPCTRTDRCQAGACAGSNPVVCVAADACHEPGVCDVATGGCTNPAKPDGTACNDSSACTASDTCIAGACTGGSPTVCPTPTCRETFACDPATGTCIASETGASGCVAEEAMVVGQVLSDETGAPLDGATVRMGTQSAVTKGGGRYGFATRPGEALLTIERDGFTSVDRTVTAAGGVGTVAVDARLTPLGAALAIGAAPAVLTANLARFAAAPVTATVNMPAGAASPATTARLTPLSAQGLPALLPLGWSPVAAFDLRVGDGAAVQTGLALPLVIQGILASSGPVYLVAYDRGQGAWRLEAAALAVENGSVASTLGHTGSFALVVPDGSGAPPVPAVGAVLTGLDPVAVSPAMSAFGAGQPQALPASGGAVEGRIVLPSATPLPSGTVLSAAISETYNLTAGPVASAATRVADVVLYRAPIPVISSATTAGAASLLGASFAITPSRAYTPATLARGNLHVDVLAGREAQRGKLGGRDAVMVTDGAATLSVVEGALPANTVVAVEEVAVPDYVPRSTDLVPVTQINVDLAMAAPLAVSAELAVGGVTAADGEAVLLARIERVDGVASPVVVSLGTLREGKWVFGASPGLAGVVREGEYVVYRTGAAFGFVAGMTTAAGAAVPALVSIEGFPFVALSGTDGKFKLPAKPGEVVVRARVPGSNLAGSASAEVTAGDTASANIALEGVVTVATVVPANGAIGVERSAQITLTASAPLDPATATVENLRLFLGPPTTGQEIAVNVEVSAGRTGVAVIPSAQLQPGTAYTFQASGLKDVYGAPVPAVAATFTTKVEVPPVYDTGSITFGMPDADGQVAIDVPAGTLPPGTTILITNEGNGAVVSFTVGNDGSLHQTILASIDDKLTVTVIDPSGGRVEFVRSQYVGADGTTAVGPGGGTVRGPGGVELRIPEGALDKGTVFKLAPFGPDAFPERPAFDGLSFGSGLRVEVQGSPTLKREIDLVFPKPAGAPADAPYFVYRRVVPGPGEATSGAVTFEVIDHAFVEGTGANAKVVTASPPFPGVKYLAANTVPGSGLTASAAQFYLMWSYPRELLGFVPKGLVTGKVLRAKWEPNATAPTYIPIDPIDGPVVVARADDPSIFSTVASDGTYALWTSPTGGDVKLVAYRNASLGAPCPADPSSTNEIRCATAVKDEVLFSDGILRKIAYGDRVWKANILFPAQQPPPASPLVEIKVFQEVGGQRQIVDGVALENKPLIFGFKTSNTAQVVSIEVLHHGARDTDAPVRNDPLAGQPSAVDQIAEYTTGQSGLYTVRATALPLPQGSPFALSTSFRVVAAGGGITTPVPDAAPVVLAARTVPVSGSRGVPITVAPQIVFSEPVRNVKDAENSVWLTDEHGGHVEVDLTGINLTGMPVPLTDATVVVTSVIATPKTRLAYEGHYKLRLGSDILDLDNTLPDAPAAARSLEIYSTDFHTVVPAPLLRDPPDPSFSSPGIASVGNRAYVVENVQTHYGLLKTFDLTDPTAPTEVVAAQARLLGRPMGLAAERESEGVTRVVVATGPDNHSLPSNLRVYRVHDNGPSEWIGAASLTTTAAEGIVQAVAMMGDVAYTASTFKGIQIVDLSIAKMLFDQAGGDVSKVRVPLNTDGTGFGREAVVATIPVLKGTRPAFLSDIKVAPLNDGFVQPIVVATGDIGLVVLNPQTSQIIYQAPGGGGLDIRGRALDVGKVNGRDIVVIVGEDASGPAMTVVDITTPAIPIVRATIQLQTKARGVELSDLDALVGTESGLTVVQLDNPSSPKEVGHIRDVGARVSVSDSGVVVTAMPDTAGRPEILLGGVRTATLGPLAVVTQEIPGLFQYDALGQAVGVTDVVLDYKAFGVDDPTAVGKVTLEGHSTVFEVVTVKAQTLFQRSYVDGPAWISAGYKMPPGHDYFIKPRVEVHGATVVGAAVRFKAVEIPCNPTVAGGPDVFSRVFDAEQFPARLRNCLEPEFARKVKEFEASVKGTDTSCFGVGGTVGNDGSADSAGGSDGVGQPSDASNDIGVSLVRPRIQEKSVVRSDQRQYLMYWSARVSGESEKWDGNKQPRVDPETVAAFAPGDCWKKSVQICWVDVSNKEFLNPVNGDTEMRRVYDRDESRRGARVLFNHFGSGTNEIAPVERNNHGKGLAIDLEITWPTLPSFVACKKDKTSVVVDDKPRCEDKCGDGGKLRIVARDRGLKEVDNDPNHYFVDPGAKPFCPPTDVKNDAGVAICAE